MAQATISCKTYSPIKIKSHIHILPSVFTLAIARVNPTSHRNAQLDGAHGARSLAGLFFQFIARFCT